MPDDVELSIDGQSIARGARLDLDALRHALKSRPREVIVEAAPQIPFGQVLAIAAEARAAGARVAFGGSFAGDIDPEESETIRSMPRALGWERGDDRLHDQEIVMCFDRREPWSKVARTLLEFAELRIWRLSFAGVDEAGRRTKVPVPLSVHR